MLHPAHNIFHQDNPILIQADIIQIAPQFHTLVIGAKPAAKTKPITRV
jgi:hypothetical protein